MPSQFTKFKTKVALQVIHRNKNEISILKKDHSVLSKSELDVYFLPYDLKRLDIYARNMADYHLILDLLPTISRLFFLGKLEVKLTATMQKVYGVLFWLQMQRNCSDRFMLIQAILLGMGLQHKSVDTMANELGIPSSQVSVNVTFWNFMLGRIWQSIPQNFHLGRRRTVQYTCQTKIFV